MKKCLFVILVLISFTVHAKPPSIDGGIGLGIGYGIFGGQLSIAEEEHRFRIGISLIGGSLGYDYMLTKHLSVGITAGAFKFLGRENLRAFTIMHHFSKSYNDGWNVSLDVGRRKYEPIFSSSTEEKSFLSVGFGYTF